MVRYGTARENRAIASKSSFTREAVLKEAVEDLRRLRRVQEALRRMDVEDKQPERKRR